MNITLKIMNECKYFNISHYHDFEEYYKNIFIRLT